MGARTHHHRDPSFGARNGGNWGWACQVRRMLAIMYATAPILDQGNPVQPIRHKQSRRLPNRTDFSILPFEGIHTALESFLPRMYSCYEYTISNFDLLAWALRLLQIFDCFGPLTRICCGPAGLVMPTSHRRLRRSARLSTVQPPGPVHVARFLPLVEVARHAVFPPVPSTMDFFYNKGFLKRVVTA